MPWKAGHSASSHCYDLLCSDDRLLRQLTRRIKIAYIWTNVLAYMLVKMLLTCFQHA